jgi:predicted XRE-type DNA-binding protein
MFVELVKEQNQSQALLLQLAEVVEVQVSKLLDKDLSRFSKSVEIVTAQVKLSVILA